MSSSSNERGTSFSRPVRVFTRDRTYVPMRARAPTGRNTDENDSDRWKEGKKMIRNGGGGKKKKKQLITWFSSLSLQSYRNLSFFSLFFFLRRAQRPRSRQLEPTRIINANEYISIQSRSLMCEFIRYRVSLSALPNVTNGGEKMSTGQCRLIRRISIIFVLLSRHAWILLLFF